MSDEKAMTPTPPEGERAVSARVVRREEYDSLAQDALALLEALEKINSLGAHEWVKALQVSFDAVGEFKSKHPGIGRKG